MADVRTTRIAQKLSIGEVRSRQVGCRTPGTTHISVREVREAEIRTRDVHVPHSPGILQLHMVQLHPRPRA